MASSLRRSRLIPPGLHSNLSNFPEKSLKFYKIIFNPRAHRLKIPTEYIERSGLALPERVFLRAPSGPEFEVELINSDGKTWLQKGWDDFREYYSLGFGHFLVFEYDRDSYNFHVLIFDKTAAEIEYPSHDDNNRGTKDYRVSKMADTGSQSDDDNHRKFPEPLKNLKREGDALDEGGQTEDKVSGNHKKRKTMAKAVDKETSPVYRRAQAFVSNNPDPNPYLISLMYPSYVSGWFILAIPVSFVRKYMPHKKNNVTLRRDGSVWPVKCCIHEPNARIVTGWRDFARDNVLKVGDVCVFQLSRSDKFVWDVSVFRS